MADQGLTAADLAAFDAEIWRRAADLKRRADAIGVSPLYLSIAVGMVLEDKMPSLRLVAPSQGRFQG